MKTTAKLLLLSILVAASGCGKAALVPAAGSSSSGNVKYNAAIASMNGAVHGLTGQLRGPSSTQLWPSTRRRWAN